MWLNCKAIKKWQPPYSTSTPPPSFQVYPSFLAKKFALPQLINFQKVLPPLILGWGGGGGGGSNYVGFYQMKLISWESYGQILQTFSKYCTRQYLILFRMWIYSKSSLTGIMFGFKKLKKYPVEIFIFCYDYKHLPFSNKIYQPEINFTRPFNVIPRTIPCNSII